MIQIRSLKKSFGGKPVLDGVDLDIDEGDTLAIMGPSGTGKSVLLKHIVGLVDPDEGEIRVDDVSVVGAGGTDIGRIRSKISYVFQNSALFDSLTVNGNILLGLREGYCDSPEVDCHEIICRALEHVNLEPDVLDLLPAELSGGMQKRVAIARAIVGEQKYILYDEPTTGLDPMNASVINGLIDHLNELAGRTSVIVTHDIESAFGLGDRIALLSGGKVRALGTPDEVRESSEPAVRRFLDPDRVPAEVA